MVKNPDPGLGQPFRGNQPVILERRKADGSLDFSGAQPPTEAMTFDALYEMFFRATRGTATAEHSASWDDLREWLETRSWTVRACTW